MSEDFYPIFVSLFFVFGWLIITGYQKGIKKESIGKFKTLWIVIFVLSLPILLFVSGFLLLGFLLDSIGIGNPMR
jgi:hypothetical protein